MKNVAERSDVQFSSESITVPRWVLILMFGLLLNIATVLFSAGVLWSKVSSLEERFKLFETHLVYKASE